MVDNTCSKYIREAFFITCYGLILAVILDIIFHSTLLAGGTPPAPDSDDIIGQTLCNLVEVISGQIARAIATLAIFAVGIGLFMGKVSWGLAATTAGGVAVIFGANTLVDFFAVGTTGTCDTAA